MSYSSSYNAQSISTLITDLLIHNIQILQVRLSLYALKIYLLCLNNFKFFFISAAIVLSLLIYFIYCVFFVAHQKYILITHRDINTKVICNILVYKLPKNFNLAKQQLTLDTNKIQLINNKNNMMFKSLNLNFLCLKQKKFQGELYNQLVKILFHNDNVKVDIYIYDTHNRYIDLLCTLFGENELIQSNFSLMSKKYIFSTQVYNKKIKFYSVDKILKKQNITILEMVQTLDAEYQALQKIYYYDINQKQHNIIFKYLLKITKFIAYNINNN
jgi:hypothetical protein